MREEDLEGEVAMRRTGRWMLNALTVVAAFVAVVSIAFWPAGYWWKFKSGFVAKRQVGWTSYVLDSWNGTVMYEVTTFHYDSVVVNNHELVRGFWTEVVPNDHARLFAPWSIGGFGFESLHDQSLYFSVPCWLLVVAGGLLPTIRCAAWRRRQNSARCQQCTACSYDLTGNVSGVCPECGRKIAEAK